MTSINLFFQIVWEVPQPVECRKIRTCFTNASRELFSRPWLRYAMPSSSGLSCSRLSRVNVETRRVFPGCPHCSGRERLFLYVLFLPVWTKYRTPERPSCDEFNLGMPLVFDCWYPTRTPHDLRVPKSKVITFSFRLSGRLTIVTVGLVFQMSGHAWVGCKDVSRLSYS